MKRFLVWLTISFLLAISTAYVNAAEIPVAESSAKFSTKSIIERPSFRYIRLRKFLNSYNSPLAIYTQDFINYADKYSLDWRLVPAIAGVESTFGKQIPKNSFNAYGWANGAYSFNSWENSIEVVSRSLRERYIDRGATSIEKIGKIYAPPSTTWDQKVKYFMRKIDPLPVEFSL